MSGWIVDFRWFIGGCAIGCEGVALLVANVHRVGIARFQYVSDGFVERNQFILAIQGHFVASETLGEQRHGDHDAGNYIIRASVCTEFCSHLQFAELLSTVRIINDDIF